MKQLVIGGIPLNVWGDSESPKRGIFLLHGRSGNSADMAAFAQMLIMPDTLVFTFDHRNHGSRIVNASLNRGWPHNPSHALDMYAIMCGAAMDISLLIKMIPLWIPSEFKHWITVGFSLGGHAAILSASIDSSISACVSICGTGDYSLLMKKRAASMRMDLNAQNWPAALDNMSSEYTHLLASKKLFLIHGGLDTLVPFSSNANFVQALTNLCQNCVEVFIDPDAAHSMTSSMQQKAIDWIKQL
jgi:predicted esterase